MSKCYWHELTTVDFRNLDSSNIAILPIGAIEQHGPHLPVWTDTRIVNGIIECFLTEGTDSANVLVLPTQTIGQSLEHLDFPGSLALSPDILLEILKQLTASLTAVGIRRLLILNSHGGNQSVISEAILALRRRYSMLAVTTSWFALGVPKSIFNDYEMSLGLHAGAIETSLMLHLEPDLVRRDQMPKAKLKPFVLESKDSLLSPFGPANFGWLSQDICETGAWGDATIATAQKGEQILKHIVGRLSELVEQIAQFDLSHLQPAAVDPLQQG
ncbi:creatininase family protein [Nostoc sp.]|uniref:creatininase family protein n=1 Tax=Nostoc sp. TaxID=1180 RepID=UPI002FF6D018